MSGLKPNVHYRALYWDRVQLDPSQVSFDLERNPVRVSGDKLTGFRDRRFEFDSPSYSSAEQLKAHEAMRHHIP
jgi:hypothetical protein